MALSVCPECGGKVSTTAPQCPHCGHTPANEGEKQISKPQKVPPLFSCLVFIGLIVGGYFVFQFVGVSPLLALGGMQQIEDEVAKDAVREYELGKKGGDKMEICVLAGMASMAYLQAEDETNYLKWKEIEEADCKAAGMPFSGGTGMQDMMQQVEEQVASDMVQGYELAKKGGDKMEICVHAGMVSAGYLQAGDETNYLKWKEIEKADCKAAGMPVM